MYWSTDGFAALRETVFFKPVADFARAREPDFVEPAFVESGFLDFGMAFFFGLLFLVNSGTLHHSYLALNGIT